MIAILRYNLFVSRLDLLRTRFFKVSLNSCCRGSLQLGIMQLILVVYVALSKQLLSDRFRTQHFLLYDEFAWTVLFISFGIQMVGLRRRLN
jgi:hypothetical protein